MKANAFRRLHDYHFSENRKIWDSFVFIRGIGVNSIVNPIPPISLISCNLFTHDFSHS